MLRSIKITAIVRPPRDNRYGLIGGRMNGPARSTLRLSKTLSHQHSKGFRVEPY